MYLREHPVLRPSADLVASGTALGTRKDPEVPRLAAGPALNAGMAALPHHGMVALRDDSGRSVALVRRVAVCLGRGT